MTPAEYALFAASLASIATLLLLAPRSPQTSREASASPADVEAAASAAESSGWAGRATPAPCPPVDGSVPHTSTQPPRVEAEAAVSAETRPGRDSARPAAVGGGSDE